jgi:hypothetical protein
MGVFVILKWVYPLVGSPLLTPLIENSCSFNFHITILKSSFLFTLPKLKENK